MKHATSYENCHKRKSTQVFAKTKAQLDPTIKKNVTQSDTCSLNKIQEQNLTALLDMSPHIIDHPAVSCFSHSRVSEREPGAQTQDTHDQSSGTQPS